MLEQAGAEDTAQHDLIRDVTGIAYLGVSRIYVIVHLLTECSGIRHCARLL
jgi:hypothetical protein